MLAIFLLPLFPCSGVFDGFLPCLRVDSYLRMVLSLSAPKHRFLQALGTLRTSLQSKPGATRLYKSSAEGQRRQQLRYTTAFISVINRIVWFFQNVSEVHSSFFRFPHASCQKSMWTPPWETRQLFYHCLVEHGWSWSVWISTSTNCTVLCAAIVHVCVSGVGDVRLWK